MRLTKLAKIMQKMKQYLQSGLNSQVRTYLMGKGVEKTP